jgi:hypothetical protein
MTIFNGTEFDHLGNKFAMKYALSADGYRVRFEQGTDRGSFRTLEPPFRPLLDGLAADSGRGEADRIPIQPSAAAPIVKRNDFRRSFCSVIVLFSLIVLPHATR